MTRRKFKPLGKPKFLTVLYDSAPGQPTTERRREFPTRQEAQWYGENEVAAAVELWGKPSRTGFQVVPVYPNPRRA